MIVTLIIFGPVCALALLALHSVELAHLQAVELDALRAELADIQAVLDAATDNQARLLGMVHNSADVVRQQERTIAELGALLCVGQKERGIVGRWN